MKKFLASGIYNILIIGAILLPQTMIANDIKGFCEEEKEISRSNYELICFCLQDKEPPDLFEIHEIGYWKGMYDAYSKILERL